MTERLDRIEAILDRLAIGIEETKALANSNAKTIQAILENQGTSRLNLEETKALANSNAKAIQAMLESQATHRLEHQERIDRLDDVMTRIASVQEGMSNWLVAIDDTQPTVLRRLNSIEDKINKLLERD
jgi:hypothetical protein